MKSYELTSVGVGVGAASRLAVCYRVAGTGVPYVLCLGEGLACHSLTVAFA